MFNLWTIYDKPSDYPDKFVARLFVNGLPTLTMMTAENVNELRIRIAYSYSDVRWHDRHSYDDPCIVECWF